MIIGPSCLISEPQIGNSPKIKIYAKNRVKKCHVQSKIMAESGWTQSCASRSIEKLKKKKKKLLTLKNSNKLL